MKTYEIEFLPSALKEWRKLDSALRNQFAKKLEKLRANPHVPSARLAGWPNAYRIKLRRSGYRLGYRVFDERVVIVVIAIERRDKNKAYELIEARLRQVDERI